MRILWSSALVALLAAETAVSSSWFTKAPYNKWHETELERWLSDHDVPYPTPADRKDLENLVKSKWTAAVESPYVNWDTTRLQKQIQAQGDEIKKGAEKNKDQLVNQVKAQWTDTSDTANSAYNNVKDWIFDSWTESQLKSFCDKHGIPVPQPRKRDQLLKAARDNYQTAATKLSETAGYPGNWLYSTWAESDLKSWLDDRGIPAPQPSNRDALIASVRRNSRVASLNVAAAQASAKSALSSISASAEAATETLNDQMLDSWSESQIKEWCDKNGIKVPQGSTRNELMAIARKHYASIVSSSTEAASAYGAATTSAGNEYAKATESARLKGGSYYDYIYSNVMKYADEAQIALGVKTNLASSASKSAVQASKSVESVYSKASKSASKGEL